MRYLKKILFITLMMMIPLPTVATPLFKTLDAKNGLTSSQVNCIIKDSRGYVWFGTPSGLYRYDGYTFKNFQCNSQDGSSLPDSYIISLQEALDGTIWVETAAGFCVYHPQNESFERDMHQVFSRMGIDENPTLTFIDSYKNFWLYVPQKGIVAYNMQQQLLYEFSYTNDAQGIPNGKICSMGECRDGAIAVYENGTIVCLDIMHKRRQMWQTTEIARQHLHHSNTLKVFADQMDNIWLYGQGTLLCYKKKADTWDHSVGTQLGLTGTNVDRSVFGMAGDRNGNIWVGTDCNGLIKMNVNTHAFEPVHPKSGNDAQAGSDFISVQSVYVDNTDLLWVGTERNGVAYYGKNIYRFGTKRIGDITAMAEDTKGQLWLGTGDKGLVGYEGAISGKRVTVIEATPDGSVWIGTKRGGLTRIQGDKITIYSVQKDSSRTVINNEINDLCTDQQGNLWIATSGGLQMFNTKTQAFSSYTKENRRIHTNSITSLHYGTHNRLLVGTNEGLLALNLSSGEKTVITGNSTNMQQFTNNYITAVFEDSRGLLWVGTREGLNILSTEDDKVCYLTEREGLCNNNICGITEDKRHNIWISTSNGICRIVTQRNHEQATFNFGLYNYDMADGLQSNEFNRGAILTKKDGTVLFGGLYGINWLQRLEKDETRSLPRVMLTQLFVGEREILIGHEYDGNIPLQQALNESNEITLTSEQNTFTIKFAAGNYNQSERLQFMYWMEGLDKDWKNGNSLSHGVTFNNLGTGTYSLHVKAISAEGVVSNQERVLTVTILPPWWMSWWMIVIYIVSIIVISFAWHKAVRHQLYIHSKKKAIINELTCQREEIKAASDDLRQPMARMASIIGNLSDRDTSIEGREQLNALHFQMLQIITRISEMQTSLEHPEEKAKTTAADRLQLNDNGVVSITQLTEGELTSEIRSRRTDLVTQQYTIVFIDDNPEFLKFITKSLGDIYNIRTYNDTSTALADLELLKADIIVCKQNMPGMTGSELCNRLKTTPVTQNTKFVLTTDGVLTPQDMQGMNISLSCDDYLAKPFNIQETAMRFNRLLGLAPNESINNIIEGNETRMLEGRNSSMTTATESYADALLPHQAPPPQTAADKGNQTDSDHTDDPPKETLWEFYQDRETIGDYSMNDEMDKQLMRNVEQYVVHNMSRGQISLEDMATAMGMGRVPFFHKIRNLTSKTPAELVRELRLKHACTLLIHTDINMSELAINIGFMTAENFIYVFKEKYGMSPLEYRLRNRRNENNP